MLVVRIREGIVQHFPVRQVEWLMVYPALGMWMAFNIQRDMFSTSPSFTVLARWADEEVWAWLCLCCGLCRLIALSVNGTFRHTFPYTPHMRVAASFIGIMFWSQFTLGFFQAYMNEHGAFSAVIAYSSFCLAELINTYRSWSDVGATHQRGK